jgi:hypothetical protein
MARQFEIHPLTRRRRADIESSACATRSSMSSILRIRARKWVPPIVQQRKYCGLAASPRRGHSQHHEAPRTRAGAFVKAAVRVVASEAEADAADAHFTVDAFLVGRVSRRKGGKGPRT